MLTVDDVRSNTSSRLWVETSMEKSERALLLLTILAAAALPWLATRPPLVDLPQHAAEVTLWRDLISGASPWANILQINVLTPYLIGYGIMLPIACVLPAVTAAKIVLSASIIAFYVACSALRKSMGGDPRLDWLGSTGLFGYAWQNGFLTYLAAAPVGIMFLINAHRHAAVPDFRRGCYLVALGVACLFAHGLLFLIAVILGFVLAARGLVLHRSQIARTLIPYLTLGLVFIVFRLVSKGNDTAFYFDDVVFGVPGWFRPASMLGYVTDIDNHSFPRPRIEVILLILMPIALKLPLNRSGGAWIFAAVTVLLLTIPSYAIQTAGLVERLSLLLPVSYAVLFRVSNEPRTRLDGFVMMISVLCCWSIIAVAGRKISGFGVEAKTFETVLDAAPPGHRALGLIDDERSPAAESPRAYRNWASWYGAEKGGFVDFSFAAYPPQVVHFRPLERAQSAMTARDDPKLYDWRSPEARLYDYFFLRGTADFVSAVVRSSPCQLQVVASDGPWTLLGRITPAERGRSLQDILRRPQPC